MSQLAGRRALVTGGGRGIGRAVALDLARGGGGGGGGARTRGEVEAVASGIGRRRTGGGPHHGRGRPESVRAGFARAREALGGLDILVSAAGIAPTAPLAKTSDAVWREVVETNLSGVLLLPP